MPLYSTGINAEHAAEIAAIAAYNQEASAAIPHGRIVAAGLGATATNRGLKSNQNVTGMMLPTIANYWMRGIAKCHNGRSAAAGEGFEVITAGYALAAIRVPQSTDLAVGVELAPATVHDVTNNKTLFATSTAAANPGVLEPVIYNSVIRRPRNPFARLLEALTASASADTIQMAYVEVIPRKPLPFEIDFSIPPSNVVNKTINKGYPFGPALIMGMHVQAGDWGATGGSTAFQLKNCPLLGTTDAQDVFSTAITVANDADNGASAGLGATQVNGDIDSSVSLGTGGSHGVLGAVAQRLMCTQSMLQLNITYTTVTAVIDLYGRIYGISL